MIFNESKPIYLQIADLITEKIATNEWTESERIPSVREFAGAVEVNPNTVMRAYESLSDRGIIYNRRGIGFFVSAGAKDIVHQERKAHIFDEALLNLAEQMKMLGVSLDDVVAHLKTHLKK